MSTNTRFKFIRAIVRRLFQDPLPDGIHFARGNKYYVVTSPDGDVFTCGVTYRDRYDCDKRLVTFTYHRDTSTLSVARFWGEEQIAAASTLVDAFTDVVGKGGFTVHYEVLKKYHV